MTKSQQKKKPSLSVLRAIVKKIPFSPKNDKLWDEAASVDSVDYHLFAAKMAIAEIERSRNLQDMTYINGQILKAQRHLALLEHYGEY